jgi:hypothetical protein
LTGKNNKRELLETEFERKLLKFIELGELAEELVKELELAGEEDNRRELLCEREELEEEEEEVKWELEIGVEKLLLGEELEEELRPEKDDELINKKS